MDGVQVTLAHPVTNTLTTPREFERK